MLKQYRETSSLWIVVFLWVANLFALFPSGKGFAQAPGTLWTKTYGGGLGDCGYSVQQTSDGGYIIVGYTLSFGVGNSDFYLLRTDANGDTLWTKTYGSTDRDYGYSVQQTSDGGYIITGRVESVGAGYWDVYLIKTDANGDTVWTKTYGGTAEDAGRSVQQTPDGGYIIVGYTLSFGAGKTDVYLIKTDANGDTLWTKVYGGIETDLGESIQQTVDGGCVIVGYTMSFGAGERDAYLIKIDSFGDTLWTKTYGGTEMDWCNSVEQTSDGGYIITGWTKSFGAGEDDVYLVKTDAAGDTLWTRTYGGTELDRGNSVKQTTDGGYIMTGYTKSFGAGEEDVYLIKIDASGDTFWTKTYGSTNFDRGYSAQQTTDGGYIIAGYTDSYGAGYGDVYLIRIKSEVGINETSQEVFFISQSEPNPFQDRTSLIYQLLKSSNVHIVIYDLLGQEVKTLVNDQESAGTNTVIWDGRDSFGKEVTSGVYFYKIQVDNYTETRKMILMR